MAQRVIVQDGQVLYRTGDPLTSDIDFSVEGNVTATKQLNVGNDPLTDGIIQTPITSGADLIVRTNNNGTIYGNIRFDSITNGGSLLLNNVAWPDGTVSPVPGMYLGVASLNTLQFFSLPSSTPSYELISSTASQTVFNTTVNTIANLSGVARLLIFVNGVKRIEGITKSYTVTGANQVTFNSGLNLNDDVEFYAFP